ncbi:peptide deformylase [Corynebacterium ulceribovis]|uniref:peptide deformylase n=1 Tax=Corynebacterium ulceribovis TaxID=487732 RepID=UPI00035E2370|nr:peptide deformylase [Corynebacterium ulceribovis]
MALLPLRFFGDPVLTTRAEEVTSFDEALGQLIADMTETMHAEGGIGLAANQVGVLRRVFVYDVDGVAGHIVNPVWQRVGDDTDVVAEGCLSIPDIRADVQRPTTIQMSGVDMTGRPVSMQATGMLARCMQHESDHLDGVLFVKRLAPADRKQAMAEIRHAEWFLNR